MNENHNNGRGIFYGVIGVATLVVAIIGATFAYFTATQNNNTAISGNAAAVGFGLSVTRIENSKEAQGLIPMSNSMVEKAVSDGASHDKEFCVDERGNLVCQIYQITLTNSSASSLFLDGYITLTDKLSQTSADVAGATTVMRWAQIFATTTGSGENEKTVYSTGGTTTLGADTELTIDDIDAPTADDNTGKNLANIYVDNGTTAGTLEDTDVLGSTNFGGISNPVIKANFIRLSQHASGDYARNTDLSDALVFNQSLSGLGTANLYFVVWLSENGDNQNVTAQQNTGGFFSGNVTFNSGAGGEVTATFSGYTKVQQETQATP